jgi:putative tryptophan/tyrosine transport system substrate-binding protein
LPTVYNRRFFVDAGGLMSYVFVVADQYGQAVSYVDTILLGAKPSELPVQSPTRCESVLNLKTAKSRRACSRSPIG